MEPQQRTVCFDLTCPPERRQAVLSSIRAYRAALRQAFGLMCQAAFAAGEIEWTAEDNMRVKPNNDRAKIILALGTQQATLDKPDPKAERKRGEGDAYTVRMARGPIYELRAEITRLLPTAMSFVNDSARRDLKTAWDARDPKLPATRGWLTLQGARGVALFNRRGIGIPVATGRPKLEKRGLSLKWDHDIGEITFGFGELDKGRLYTFKALRDGDDGWKLGTVYLSERDGKLVALLTHEKPADLRDVDPTRVLAITFADDDATLFRYSGPDGLETADVIASAGVRAFLAESHNRRNALEERRGSNGQPRRPWGFRKGWQEAQTTLDRHTLIRTRVVEHHNHAWTRRIVDRAVKWRCGTIKAGTPPQRTFNDGSLVGSIGEWPWNWSQFASFLKYKAKEKGIEVVEG